MDIQKKFIKKKKFHQLAGLIGVMYCKSTLKKFYNHYQIKSLS